MERKTRRFGLGDLLILISGIGGALAVLRGLWQGLTVQDSARHWSVTPNRLLIAAALSACATPLTLACLAFRLRRPRPAWRYVALQPGTSAMVVCSVIFAFQIVEVAISLSLPKTNILDGTQVSSIQFGESVSLVVMRSKLGNGLIGHVEPMGCFGILTTSFTDPCGPAVAGMWLVLGLSGRWRPERSWIDRFGRVLGATWILISLLVIYPAN